MGGKPPDSSQDTKRTEATGAIKHNPSQQVFLFLRRQSITTIDPDPDHRILLLSQYIGTKPKGL
jgi:hypothetical protein